MLYLKRKIDAFLETWRIAPDHKPLIVKGPRQVGKTESIKRFASQHYKNLIYINFVEEPKYKIIAVVDSLTTSKKMFQPCPCLVFEINKSSYPSESLIKKQKD